MGGKLNSQDLLNRILNSKETPFKNRKHIWVDYLKDAPKDSVYLEFGVRKGKTINYMAKVRPDCIFHGFDSFEGLPERWRKGFEKGHFKIEPEEFKNLIFKKNVIIHKGWFSDTIHEAKQISNIYGIHFDCDLGSSTTTVLNGLSDIILNSKPYILFDEMYGYEGYEMHEFKSFLDWVNTSNANFQVISHNGLQVLLKII
jgi:hypothetical protein